MAITKEQVLEALKNVDDPDLKKDIVTLGMVRDLVVEGNNVNFTVMLTTPACPMKEMIHKASVNAVLHFVDKNANVNVKMDADVTTRKNVRPNLPNIKNIIIIASGKGGVGKSTVAANIAVGLAMQNAKVGFVDADIYGPSAPIMFDVVGERPLMVKTEEGSKMAPIESYGVKINSMGFLTGLEQPIPMRGPRITTLLTELISNTNWGELDYLVIDMPPGTGDVHLSITATLPITGAIIVTTPQQVALSDTLRGINMFKMEQVKVPILGIVENMAYFTPAELPNNKYYIFGREGGKQLAEKINVPLLAQIPLVQSICEAADAGRPAVLQETTPQGLAFAELAKRVAQEIAIKNAEPVPATIN